MASPLAKLFVSLGLDTGPFATGMKSIGGLTGVAFGAAGAAAGDFAAQGVAAFGQLDTKMREVFTLLPGISEQAKNELTQDARDFAVQFGLSTDEAIAGLYNSLSAGLPPENVFAFMETAQKAATAGVTDLSSSIGLLTAVTKGYGDTSQEFTQQVSDLAFTTVKLGQTTFPELAASIGEVVPGADALGISVEELNAVFATLTGVTGNASKVSTQFKAVQTALMTQNPIMTKSLNDAGFATSKAALETLGLQGTLEMLVDSTGGSQQQLQKMFGSVEALTALLPLTSAQAGKFTSNLDAMGDVTNATETAFAEMDSGIEASGRKIGAFFNDLKLTVGKELQAFGPLFYAFGPQMGRWMGRGFGAVAGIIGAKLGGPAVRVAIAAAGKAGGIIYQGALFVGSKMTAAAVALWGLMGGPKVMAAAAAAGAKTSAAFAGAANAGGMLGTLAGAMTRGLPLILKALGPVSIAVGIAWVIKEPLHEFIDRTFGEVGKEMTDIESMGAFNKEALRRGYMVLAGGLVIDPATGKAIAEDVRQSIRDHVWEPVADGAEEDAATTGRSIGRSWGQATEAIATGASGAAAAWRTTIPKNFASGLITKPVEDEFDDAVKSARQGFGRLKDAFDNAPQLISDDQRLKNMVARRARFQAELLKAQQAGDTRSVQHWKSAIAKQEAALEGFSRKTGQTWSGIRRKTREESRGAADTAIRQAERTVDVVGATFRGMGDSSETWGAGMMGGFAEGIRSRIQAVVGAASAAAAAVAALLKPGSPTKAGPLSMKGGAEGWGRLVGDQFGKGLRSAGVGDVLGSTLSPRLAVAGAGGRNVTVNINGPVYGGEAGLRQLSREIQRAVRIQSRDR